MNKIKFGTDGWRGVIARDFTVENVARVAQGTASWVSKNFTDPSVVIGYDCRFGGEMFSQVTAMILADQGIKVKLSNAYASTPMVSFGTVSLNCSLGVVITASHNPPSYNGFKLKGHFGGPLLPDQVSEVEELIPITSGFDPLNSFFEDYVKSGKIEIVDLEKLYLDHIEKNFDLDLIRKSGIHFAYDAMYGAGQGVMKKLFPDMTFLHSELNPSFNGISPEPIHKNLLEFSELIKNNEHIQLGVATDGDADRIGMYDSKGNFIDSHHIILLLIHYLVKYKHMSGKVVTAFSITERIRKICQHYGLELEVVKIGFKYICGIMLKEDVLIGGEESGGIAIKGHIPERDGIWIALVILEFMAKSGKTIEELIEEVYEIVGPFAFERSDLHLRNELKDQIMEKCASNSYSQFGDYKVQKIETTDGYKFYFNDDEWLMIRPSGTEPVLRTYAESHSRDEAFNILNATKKQLLGA